MEERGNNNNVIRVLTLGYTGAGKSTFCNFLSRTEHFEESPFGDPCTQEIQSLKFNDEIISEKSNNNNNNAEDNKISTSIEIIDSPGLGEEKSETDLRHYQRLIQEIETGVDFVILVVRFDLKFDSNVVPTIQFYKKLLKSYEQQNRFMVVFGQLTDHDYLHLKTNYVGRSSGLTGWNGYKADKLEEFKEKFNFSDSFFFEFLCSVSPSKYVPNVDNIYNLSLRARSNILDFFFSKGKIDKLQLYYPILPRFNDVRKYLLKEKRDQLEQLEIVVSNFDASRGAHEVNLSHKNEQITLESNKKLETSNQLTILSTDNVLSFQFRADSSRIHIRAVHLRPIEKPKGSLKVNRFVERSMKVKKVKKTFPVEKQAKVQRLEPITDKDIVDWANRDPMSAGDVLRIEVKPITFNFSKIEEEDKNELPNSESNRNLRWFYFYELYGDAKVNNAAKITQCENEIALLTDKLSTLDGERAEIEKELEKHRIGEGEEKKTLENLRKSVALLSTVDLTYLQFIELSNYLEEYSKQHLNKFLFFFFFF